MTGRQRLVRNVATLGADVRSNPLGLAGVVILAALLTFSGFGPMLNLVGSSDAAGAPLQPPTAGHLFGTDELGRDILVRTAAGLRVSLAVGLVAAVTATVIGVVVGAIAGYRGGLIDSILSRFTELVIVIPPFFLALVAIAVLGPNVVIITVTIALTSWPVIARITRAEVSSLKSRGFVDAGRLIGAPGWYLLFREIVPNALSPVITAGTLLVGQAILAEAGLSYLGLGDPNGESLGLMLQRSQGLITSAWWVSVFPGLMLFSTVLACNLLGSALSDRRNVRVML